MVMGLRLGTLAAAAEIISRHRCRSMHGMHRSEEAMALLFDRRRVGLLILLLMVLLLPQFSGCGGGGGRTSVTLTIHVDPASSGTTVPSAGTHTYSLNHVESIAALPEDGFEFLRWDGDVDEQFEAETFVVMDSSKTLTAVFAEEGGTITLGPDDDEPMVGLDGLTLAAMDGALAAELQLYIRSVPDPRPGIPLPSYLENTVARAGPFYELGAVETFWTPDGTYLVFGVPVPEGFSTECLALMVLAPPDHVMTSDTEVGESGRWYYLPGTYEPKQELFITGLEFIGEEPEVFALVEGLGCDSQEIFVLSDSEFGVTCVGFEPGECLPSHIQDTEATLDEALAAYRSLGFDEPLLSRHRRWTLWPPGYYQTGPYRYELRKMDPDDTILGIYERRPNASVAATYYLGAPAEEPRPATAWHELFHAVQFRYLSWFSLGARRINHGYLEGTATLTQGSLRPPTRFDSPGRPSRPPMPISTSVFGSQAFAWDWTADVAQSEYLQQDFWAYLGQRLDTGSGNSFLLDIVERGGFRDDIDDWLAASGPFQGLSDAYWQFAKDYSFEKETELGTWLGWTVVPHGPAGEWWSDALGDIDDHSVRLDPLTGTSSGVDLGFLRLESLSSRALAIELDPVTEGFCKVTLDVYTEDPGVAYKFYPHQDISMPDNSSYSTRVGAAAQTVYLLLSNTNIDEPNAFTMVDLVYNQRFYYLEFQACPLINEEIWFGKFPPIESWVEVDPEVDERPRAYAEDTIVTVAVPHEHLDGAFTFSHWEGGVDDPTLPETTVRMDQSRELIPYYMQSGPDEIYEQVDVKTVMDHVKHLSDRPLSANDLPAGTILLFATRQESPGKLQVLDNKDPSTLAFRYVVYEVSGAVRQSSDFSLVARDHSYDLEANQQGSLKIGDMWWGNLKGQIGDLPYLTPMNDALFYIYYSP